MKRGDIRTISGSGACPGKSRPAVIIQDDSFDAAGSVMVSAFTTGRTDAPLLRRLIALSPATVSGTPAA